MFIVSVRHVRFFHKRFMQLDRGNDGFIGAEDLLSDDKVSRYNPWLVPLSEVCWAAVVLLL